MTFRSILAATVLAAACCAPTFASAQTAPAAAALSIPSVWRSRISLSTA